MKKSKLVIIALAGLILQLATVQSVSAQQIFKAFVQAVAISTNDNGNLTYHPYGNRDIIAHCATEKGITNDTGLFVVYNRTADAFQVVQGTNDTLVCTPLTFVNSVYLSNTNGTRAERLAWVLSETNTVASGTLAATESFAYGASNQLTAFRLIGQLQFALPASGTNPPTIYKGSVFAGKSLFGFEDEEDGPEVSTASPRRY